MAASGALLVYHADRAFFKAEEDLTNSLDRLLWYKNHKFYVWASTIIAVLGVAWSSIHVSGSILRVGMFIGLGGVLYSAPIPFISWRIKDIQFVKTALIVACWVAGGVVLPILDVLPTHEIVLLAVYKCLYIFPNVLLAEWVDRTGDAHKGVLSMGARMNLTLIRVLSVVFFLVSIFLLWNWGTFAQRVDVLIVDVIGMLGMLVMILYTKTWTSEQIITVDLWVGFGLVTWLFSILTS